jgi:hypothetical protein
MRRVGGGWWRETGDLVGNNTPEFFVRDPLKFSDFIRTQRRDPGTHLKPHWRKWDYLEGRIRRRARTDRTLSMGFSVLREIYFTALRVRVGGGRIIA